MGFSISGKQKSSDFGRDRIDRVDPWSGVDPLEYEVFRPCREKGFHSLPLLSGMLCGIDRTSLSTPRST